MSELVQPKRRPLAGTHLAVVIVWFIIAGWLMGAMALSVVDAVFYGDGPLNTQIDGQPAPAAGDAAPPAKTPPTP